MCFLCRVSYRPLFHWGGREAPLELGAWPQAALVGDQGTCRWELQDDEEASWEAFLQEGAPQRGGRPSSCLASAALVPLGLSGRGGAGPWGGGP